MVVDGGGGEGAENTCHGLHLMSCTSDHHHTTNTQWSPGWGEGETAGTV